MTSLDAPEHPLQEILSTSFADLIERGAVELVLLTGEDAIEVQADEWTLHIGGWPIRLAFIALDDEPGTDEERAGALNAALGPQDLASLRDTDAGLDEQLSDALRASRDPLSVALAAILRGDGHIAASLDS